MLGSKGSDVINVLKRDLSVGIEIFIKHNRIASHRRLYGRPGQYSTVMEYMPPDHQKYLEWNGDRFRKWAALIGINTNVPNLEKSMESIKIRHSNYK